MNAKEAIRLGSTDLFHAIAIEAADMLEAEYGLKKASRIWNSNKPTDITKAHSALWKAAYHLLRDDPEFGAYVELKGFGCVLHRNNVFSDGEATVQR